MELRQGTIRFTLPWEMPVTAALAQCAEDVQKVLAQLILQTLEEESLLRTFEMEEGALVIRLVNESR